MGINVGFSDLRLEVSKMKGLNGYLTEIRNEKLPYADGLSRAIEFVETNKGSVNKLVDGETKLVVGDEEATCFQPYDDIDLFYFEA